MEWYKNITLVALFIIKIINADNNIDEDNDVSVDLETPRIKGLKLDISENNPQTNVLKWQLGIIPYYIDTNTYDSIISKRIRSAMDTIETASCIVFKSMDNVPKRNNGSWLHFTNPSNKRECVHEPILGEDGEMMIVVGFECMQHDEILHSVLHAIGFNDEVSHPHRDQYVRILWQNIQPKYRPLFRIHLNTDRTKTLVEYDPRSVMQFHDRAFSSNGGATIAAMVPGLVISPSENLSQLDKMKLRLYFGHECNKRKVDNILDTCKNVLHENASSHNQQAHQLEITESRESVKAENEENTAGSEV